MKLCIEIEVDDMAPNGEFCGEGCKGFSKSICHIFNTRLEDDSGSKFSDIKNGTAETRVIYGWRRCRPCIEMFSTFGKAISN